MGKSARPSKRRIKHWLGQSTSEGVLLAGVVAAKQRPIVDRGLCAMAKARSWPRYLFAEGFKRPQRSVPGKATQGDDRATVLQYLELSLEVRQALVSLAWGRPVCGWRAAHDGGHVGALQGKPVVAVSARGLVREAGAMQGRIEPVAGAIAGEHAPGPVGAMSSRCEADYGDSGIRVAKAIQRSGPVVLTLVATRGISGTLLTPLDQARAKPAVVDLCGQVVQCRRRNAGRSWASFHGH